MTYTIQIQFPQANENAAGYLSMVGNMPALTGSEKQVAWAEEIRRATAREAADLFVKTFRMTFGTVIRSDEDFIAEFEAEINGKLASIPGAQQMQDAVSRIFGQSTAKWWIDTARVSTARGLIERAAKGEI